MVLRESRILYFITILALLFGGCVHPGHQLAVQESPSHSDKLRVVVYSCSDESAWPVNHQDYWQIQHSKVSHFLQNIGYYEVVSLEETLAVFRKADIPKWQLERNDWALARQGAKSLGADYIIFSERSQPLKFNYYYELTLLSTDDGKAFSSKVLVPGSKVNFPTAIKQAYREVYMSARAHMLEKALKKAEVLSRQPPKGKIEDSKAPEITVKEPAPLSTPPIAVEKEKKAVIVYDLAGGEGLGSAALIFSESIREEILNLKYHLVDRDQINAVAAELKMTQSGLVDEKTAVRLGRWLGAKEYISGRLERVGDFYVLSLRRVDMETTRILSMASIKKPRGEEVTIFNDLSLAVKKLFQPSP